MKIAKSVTTISGNMNRPGRRRKWWNSLEQQWKWAFNEAILGRLKDHNPDDEEIKKIWSYENLRFVGPTGLFPNMSFELTNINGIGQMDHLKVLVISFHRVRDIEPIRSLKKLKSLFLHNNEISSLKPITNMIGLEDLYVQNNKITSLIPLRHLQALKVSYVLNNKLTDLDGITEKHSKSLKRFYVLPNEELPLKEVKKLEERGVECLKG